MIAEALARARALLFHARERPAPAAAQPAAATGTTPMSVPAPVPEAKPAAVADGWVAVCVLGLDGATLDQVVATAQREAGAIGRRAVFVTDLDAFTVFRRQRAVVEQVVDPARAAQRAPDLPWDLYRQRQFRLLGRKWRPRAVVVLGHRPPEDCLEALRRPLG